MRHNIKSNSIRFATMFLVFLFTISFAHSANAESRDRFNSNRNHNWVSGEKAEKEGKVKEKAEILEVNFSYDVDASPVLVLDTVEKKNGHAPKYGRDNDGEYTLVLLNTRGTVIKKLPFSIANEVDGPPPLAGEKPSKDEVKLSQGSFSIVVELPSDATAINILDKNKRVLASKDLEGLATANTSGEYKTITGSEFLGAYPAPANTNNTTTTAGLGGGSMQTLAVGDTLDITFIGDDYLNANDLITFHNDVNNNIAQILSIEPYKSRASQIVFHYVDNTTDLSCVYNGRVITCNNTKVTQQVNNSGTPYDKIAVIVNQPTKYGGAAGVLATDPIATAYNGPKGPLVFAHESGGHSVGNLVDEYTVSIPEYSMINCSITNPNTSWVGLVAPLDYVLGCDYPNYYRAGFGSLMYGLDYPFFNVISQNALNDKITYYSSAFIDTVIPTVAVNSPVDMSTVSNLVIIDSTSTDDTGIVRAELWVDGALYHTEYTAPFTMAWPSMLFSNGDHTLQIKSYDVAGNVGVSSVVNVLVDNIPDTTAPMVDITAPTGGATVSGWFSVGAMSTDNSGAVKKVEIWKDGVLLATSTPLSMTNFWWYTPDTINGTHTLQAKAYDYMGNVGVSSVVNVTVANPVPVVTITKPLNNSKVPSSGSLTITGNATSSLSTIASMELWLDSSKKKTCTNVATCSVNVSVSGISRGTHIVKVKAFDTVGNMGESTVTVTK